MSDPRPADGAGPVAPEGWSRPTADYLAEATEGGRMFRLFDAAVVAAAWTDDLTGLRKGYVEWADPVVLDVSRRHLVAAAAARWFDVDQVLLRVPPDRVPGIGCRYRTRYVAAAATAELAGPVPSDVLIREPTPEEGDTVHRWLARAYADAYIGLSESPVLGVLDRVRELFPLDDGSTGTLVAVVGGRHAG
jgi:hypothetical protein